LKRVLIITSEPLYPGNLLSSVFELAQAHALKNSFAVCILSVQNSRSSIASLKMLAKKIVLDRRAKEIFRVAKDLMNSIFRSPKSNRYNIEGIEVYEGVHYAFRNPKTFSEELEGWTNSGYRAFRRYIAEKGVPFIVHAHGRFLNAGWLATRIKDLEKIPFVYTEHSTYYQSGKAPLESRPLLQRVATQCSIFVAVSQSLLEQVKKFIGIDIANSVIVPNVLGKIFEEPLAAREQKGHQFVFITVASLEHKKGLDILLKAFSLAFKSDSKISLKVVGEGPLRAELVRLASELDIDSQVVFIGNQDKMGIRNLLDESHAFVLASRIETFGVVVIEALARGLPVVATRCGGPEYILTPECGILVEPEKPDELAAAMQAIINYQVRYKAGEIREYSLNTFGSQVFLERMKVIYNQVAG
jgi:teichuronic acid biosynthesis glycosyltransferase TuaC